MNPKQLAAEKAVEEIQNGMTIGLGTGTTAYFAILKIGELIKKGWKIQAVASSKASEDLAKENGITLTTFDKIQLIDLYIDGADEVDDHLNLIKGGGGALLREKVLAYNSKRFIVVVDESKLKHQLGQFPLPVEVIPFGLELTLSEIKKTTRGNLELRNKEGKRYVTDNQNFIVDCRLNYIDQPQQLNEELHRIPGVVETGIFNNEKVDQVIVGYSDGRVEVLRNKN